MKKVLTILLALIVTIGVCSFASNDNGVNEERSIFENLFSTVINLVKGAPSGTVYGVVDKTPEKYVVNTPIGEYDIERKDGGVSFLGLWAKLESRKGSNYMVDSNLGKFRINTKNFTITKE